MNIIDLARFAALVFRRGRLYHGGYDFQEERNRILRDVEGIPTPEKTRSPIRRALMANPLLRATLSEIAFVRNRMRLRGGHLPSANRKVAYVRIPKAASTALCKAVLQNRFPSLAMDPLTPEQINAMADVCLERKISKGADTEMFTIVRNPFARIVSAYREFFEEARGRFLYEDYLFGVFKRDISFRQFVGILRLIPDKLKDQHLIPQHRLLRYYDEQGIAVRIFRVEEAEAVTGYLAARGLKLAVVHQSSRAYDYHRYYDRETLEWVKTIYELDILRFGYREVYGEIKSMIEQRDVQI